MTPSSDARPARTERTRAGDLRIAWMRSRGRNLFRRPFFTGAVSTLAFVAALMVLVLVPRSADRRARLLAPRPGERPDTAVLATEVRRRATASADADSAAIRARRAALAALAQPVAVDTIPAELAAQRDSLGRTLASLDALVTRAENAPLPSSYRALAAHPAITGDPEVRSLLDSLASLERQREALAGAGGVNPAFVGLTTEAVTVGRAIQTIAERRRDAVRDRIAALEREASPPPPVPVVVDTVRPLQASVAAAERLADARRSLDSARRVLAELDRRAARARELANVGAPPVARLAAALVIGLAVGFGATLVGELRRPRVADPREVERVAGARALTVVRDAERHPSRSRRRTDRELPPLLDPGADHYRLLWLALNTTEAPLSFVTVTGDEPALAAVVAVNLAAAAALDARSALVVDTDPAACGTASLLRRAAAPGYAEVLAGAAEWSEVIGAAPVGRDQHIDVVSSGRAASLPALDEALAARVRLDLARLARRYDVVVLLAPLAAAKDASRSVLPAPDLVVAARAGHTGVHDLRVDANALRRAGTRLRGVALWATDAPILLAPGELLDEGRGVGAARLPAAERADAGSRA
jgi:Mrp family chromosome partitioning ATPase